MAELEIQVYKGKELIGSHPVGNEFTLPKGRVFSIKTTERYGKHFISISPKSKVGSRTKSSPGRSPFGVKTEISDLGDNPIMRCGILQWNLVVRR